VKKLLFIVFLIGCSSNSEVDPWGNSCYGSLCNPKPVTQDPLCTDFCIFIGSRDPSCNGYDVAWCERNCVYYRHSSGCYQQYDNWRHCVTTTGTVACIAPDAGITKWTTVVTGCTNEFDVWQNCMKANDAGPCF
jgi:hypothetical protein